MKKDSLVRLGTIQPIRESEIAEQYSVLSLGEMLLVDKELQILLFGKDHILFEDWSSAQPKTEPVPVAVVKPTPEPFLGKSREPIRKLAPPQLGKRKKAKKVKK